MKSTKLLLLTVSSMIIFNYTAIGQQFTPDLDLSLARQVFEGESSGDQLGRRAKTIGDVNNDGVDDMVVTARFSDLGGTDSGCVYIYSGLDGSELYRFIGENPFDEFGHRLAVIGDTNNDNYDDIVIGAFAADVYGDVDRGRVYVYSGKTGKLLYRITGEHAGDMFGYMLENAGDINNDGVNDLIITAPYNDSGGEDAGRAYVYSGKTGNRIHRFTGENAGDEFGFRARNAGDVDNDNRDDIIVSAPLADAYGLNSGKVYVYSGKDGDLIHTMTGEGTQDKFGIRIETAADIDLDHHDDLLIASESFNGSGKKEGAVYVYSGSTGEPMFRAIGENHGDEFGIRIRGLSDINNDNYPDIIVSASQNDDAGTNAGKVYVYSGRTGRIIYTFTGEKAGDQLGTPLGDLFDVNADGYVDIITGAAFNDSGAFDGGKVYVYSGRTGTVLYTIAGKVPNGGFGYSVASAGDPNQDGIVDIAIGAILEDPGNQPDAGRAYVFESHVIYLGSTQLTRGKPGYVFATGAKWGETVHFYAGYNGLGNGPKLNDYGGITLDLKTPIIEYTSIKANENGLAIVQLNVPPDFPLDTLYWQGVVKRGYFGADSAKSNTLTTPVINDN